MNIRKNKGITLIALVITIVILIILAGVSINVVMGDEGIFNVVKRQQEQMKILQITEKLELEKANIAIDNLGKVNLDKYIDNIQNNGNKIGEYEITSIERTETGKATIVIDGKYQYILEEENNGNVKITYETDIKNAKPVIKDIEIIQVTTSSAKVKVKVINADKYNVYINGNTEPKPQVEVNKDEITITYTNLEQQKDYTIKIEAINKNGVVEKEKTIKTIEMANLSEAEVVYTKTKTNWTNENVTTTITLNTNKNVEGYRIEYITFGIDEEVTSEKLSKGTWLQYTTAGITSTKNEKIYSRLNDGYNTTSYTSTQISNIDKEDPTISTELSSSNVTTKGFTLNVGITDTLSGYSKIIWNYKKQGDTGYIVEEEVSTQMNGSTAGTKTPVGKTKVYDNLTSGTYDAYVVVYDVAGNEETSETIHITLGTIENPGDNTATASPTEWTKGNVSITLPTKSGFTTEYQVGTLNVNGTWTSGNSTSVSSNTTIYYRYNDGKNAGGYATYTISNIDTTPPGAVAVTYNIEGDPYRWRNDLDLTLSATDSQSGVAYYETSVWNDRIEVLEVLEGENKTNWIPPNWYNSGIVKFRAVDKVGNVGPWTEEIYSIHMDTNPPNEFTISENSKTMNSIKINAYTTDVESGISKYRYYYKSSTDGEYTYVDAGANATIGGLTAGTKYSIYVVAYDLAENPRQSSNTISVVVGISASDIANNSTTYYGEVVSNYTSRVVDGKDYNNAVQNWRIFHADNENIYLISDDYVHYNYVPNSKNYAIFVNDDDYDLSFDNVYRDYTGSADIIGTKPAKWLNKYLSSYPTSTNPNIRVVAYMLDTNIWSVYAGDKAEYAIGGPTLEMFCASYKNTHSTKYIECDFVDSNGYYVKLNTDNSYSGNWIYKVIQSDYNNIYVHPNYYTWLASPSCEDDEYYIAETGYGNMSAMGLSDSGNILRPVVCLKSDVLLKPNSNGTYSILGDSKFEQVGTYNATNLAISSAGAGWPGGYADGTKVVLPAGIDGIQFGPYISLTSGYYQIEYTGINLNNEKLDYRCTYNNGQKSNTMTNFTKTNNKVSYNIYLPNDVNGFEMAVYAPSLTSNVVIDSIKIYKEEYNSTN